MLITIDWETKSEADLLKVGAWAYSEHPTTDLICACYAFDDGPIESWSPRDANCPPAIQRAVREGALFEAHNCSFEISIWHNVMAKRYGWPVPKLSQWRDTMALACYYALPAQLDRLAKVMGLGGKDPDGARLITKYSKLHLKTAKRDIPPADFDKFLAYCRKDVELERRISRMLGELPDAELAEFQIELETNIRGLGLDLAGIEAATAIVDQRSAALEKEFVALTGYAPTQTAKMLAWFQTQGLALANIQADTLEDALEELDLPQGTLKRALEIRTEISKASTRKLDAMARNAGTDGRARFQTRYHGTATGRNSGTGFQPLNLTRGYDTDSEPEAAALAERLVADIRRRDVEWLDLVYGDAMDAVSKASRYWVVPAPGHRIISGDFSSIEAVVEACLAGEEWKIAAFRAKKNIYGLAADRIFGLPEGTVTKAMPDKRQVGKRCELAFGYQGALNAWLKFDPKPIYSDDEIIGFCRQWRASNPRIVQFWRDLEQAALQCMLTGEAQKVGAVSFERDDNFLIGVLPNGKHIHYFAPELRTQMPRWHEPMINEDCATGKCRCQPRPVVTYMTMKNGQWKRVASYGGKWAENFTQATAREILVGAKKRLRLAGYTIILTVYDECVLEVPNEFGSIEQVKGIMVAGEDWATGWPISADVWEGACYRK